MYDYRLSNLSLIKSDFLKFITIFFLISIIIFLFSRSVWLTLYVVFSIGFVIIKYNHDKNPTRIEKVNELRKEWFRDLIEQKLKEIDLFSYNTSYHISQNLELPLEKFYRLELSNQQNDQKTQYTIPDLTFSEKELIEQETQISKTLVLIVFIPMLFFFLHSSFQISMSFMIINALNTLVLLELGTYQMRNPYTLLGWEKLYHDLLNVQSLISENPFDLIYRMRDYYQNLHLIELSLPPLISDKTSSIHSFRQLFKIILDFDPIIREYLLFEFLSAIKKVAVIESIHRKKWEAYRLQFVYVTSSIILFLAILSSVFALYTHLSNDYLGELDIELISLTTVPMLSEITITITLILIYFLSQPYLQKKDQWRYLIYWGLEYLCIKFGLDYIFNFMIK